MFYMFDKITAFFTAFEKILAQKLIVDRLQKIPLVRKLPLAQLIKYISVGVMNVILSYGLFVTFLWIGRRLQIPEFLSTHAPAFLTPAWSKMFKQPQPDFELIFRQMALFTQWILVILFSFQMNSRLTFQARNRSLFVLGKFYGVYFISYLLNAGSLEFFIWTFQIRAEQAQLMIIPLTAVISFTGHKFITFSRG
jgi:putative flippase GtrA